MNISRFSILLVCQFFVGSFVFASSYQVEDFGAKAQNKFDNTQSIQNAIDHCFKNGGGIVEFTNGIYLTGSFELKSNVSLYVHPSSVIKALADTSKMKRVHSKIISRMDVVPWKAFIYAQDQENIRIYGGGTIDGNGNAKCFLDDLDNSSGRPYGLFFINCQRIQVEDLSMQSSAFWMQRYFNCTHVRLHRLNIYNHSNRNNDGIDIDSSEDVVISDCILDTSDDGIVIKSEGEKTSKNIVVTNCIVATHASAIKLGTGSVGGYENITFSNIVIRRSKSKEMMHPLKVWGGLTGIDLLTTDGGSMRQVIVSNITMEDVENPIHIRLGNRLSGNVARQGYGGDGDKIQGVKASEKSTEIIRQFILEDVTITNVQAKNVGPYPVIVCGIEGYPVKRITLRDITIVCGRPGTQKDVETEPNWKGDGYPGRGMYWTHLPAYGLVTNFTKDLVVENFKAIPAEGEVRPLAQHYFKE